MTTIAPVPAPWRSDVEAALQFVGAEDSNKPATVKAAKAALVLLETVPIAALVEALPPLWARERAQRQKRAQKSLYFLAPLFVLLLVAAFLLGVSNVAHNFMMIFIPIGTCVNLTRALCKQPQQDTLLTPMQNAILRTLHLRPHFQLVPLFIDTLDSVPAKGGTVGVEAHRRHLTRLLPAWRDGDNPDLTPKQRRILIAAVSKVTGRGDILTRPLAAPLKPMDIADADFAACALATLRHSRIAPDDKDAQARTRRMLEHIPAPHTQDDPRHDLRVVAADYVSLLHR